MFHKWHSVFVVLLFFVNVDSGSQWCQCFYGFATEHSKRGECRAPWLHAVPLEACVRNLFFAVTQLMSVPLAWGLVFYPVKCRRRLRI